MAGHYLLHVEFARLSIGEQNRFQHREVAETSVICAPAVSYLREKTMKNRLKSGLAIFISAALLASCASRTDAPKSGGLADMSIDSASTAHAYKLDVAQRISQMNSKHVYAERPQALLRSVVVLRFAIDENGKLLRSEIQRSNKDRQTELIALESLKRTAPFPKPAPHLLRRGKLEMSESWLFNNDGRFQLRTVALPQMDH